MKPPYLSRLITLSLAIMAACLGLRAQSPLLFATENGLSSSLINLVSYTSDGNLWVATEDGLNRYDGSKITIYKNIVGDSTSLAHNFVNYVFEDSKGHIFVSTHNGLQMYDPAREAFTARAKGDDGNIYGNPVSAIVERHNGDLWAFGQEIRQITFDADSNLVLKGLNLPSELIGSNIAIETPDGCLWCANDIKGVYRIMPNNSVKHYLGNHGDPIIKSFTIGRDGILFAGSLGKGLWRYDNHDDKFESMAFTPADSHLKIMNVYADRGDGSILIATDGQGIKKFMPSTGNTITEPLPLANSNKAKVHNITLDQYGNRWVGIYQRGVLMVPFSDGGFYSLNQKAYDDASIIGSSCVTTLYRDKQGTLWVGTDNDGIYAVDPAFSSSRHISGDSMPNVIFCIYEDSRGDLWVASYDGGVGLLDKQTGEFKKVPLYDENGLEVSRVFDVTETDKGSIMFATMGSGLFRYSHETGTADKSTRLNADLNQWTTCLAQSKIDNCLYVGTYNGLYKLDRDVKLTHLRPDLIINTIHEDPKRKILWLGTTTGLFRFNLKSDSIENAYTTADGLPSNSVYAVENEGDYLWVSTNAGLSRFKPETGEFVNYTVEDGLQGNEFYKKTSFFDRRNGVMFFGGVNGLTFFNPDKIANKGRKYDLRITDFYIGNAPVRAGMKSGSRTIIDVPVSQAKTFRLGSHDNSFSIEFNTKQFTHSARTEFLYSFDGDSWEKMPAKSTPQQFGGPLLLTFTNVKSGNHTLKIKAIDNGIESDPIEIKINIAPVWYMTWWAKLLYAIIGLAGLYLLYRHFRQRNLTRLKEAQRLHESEIKESKLQFFTNISHEIRTPLTLVMSPLQKLMDEDPDDGRQGSYRTIMRNSQRILRLVNELMDLRKIDNKQMRLSFQKLGLKGFINDLFQLFQPAANAKDITLTFETEGIEDVDAYIDVSNFDKIIMNLISNAIKYTPNGGKVDIRLSQGEDTASDGPLRRYAQISVTDTGIGIPKSERKHVFERFYQVANNHTSGTGIGLHLTHSLVQLHYGSIQINDNPAGPGTQFVVRIPLGKDHLKPDQLVAETAKAAPRVHAQKSITVAHEVVPETPDTTSAGKKRNKLIYIVEDDADVRQYLLDNLSETFRVTAFSNGESAFQAICKEAPDLLLTDVMMPGIDGLTLARKLKQNINLNHIPIVMLTAKNREEDNLEGLESGADAYITKPFNINILTRTIHNLVDNVQRLRNVFSGSQKQEGKLEEIKVASNDDKLMERVMRVVNRHIGDSEITVETIAEEIGISRVHLHRKLKELTNQTTRDFIRNMRLQQAAKLLREKKLTVAEVSYLVGFKHPNNFSTNFREMFGMSPTAYNELHHSGNAPATPEN